MYVWSNRVSWWDTKFPSFLYEGVNSNKHTNKAGNAITNWRIPLRKEIKHHQPDANKNVSRIWQWNSIPFCLLTANRTTNPKELSFLLLQNHWRTIGKLIKIGNDLSTNQCPVGDMHYLEALMYILEISWSTLDWGSILCTVDSSKSKLKKKIGHTCRTH